jgi:sulfatase maturation enzyme AslB (radical SAM superfamily)
VTDPLVRENGTVATSLKPSYYNHYTNTADPERYVIFNKFWGSIAVVDTPIAVAVRNGNLAAIPDGERADLEASGFLVDADLDEVSTAHERYMASKRNNALLSITVELTQACNLACTYCYQNSYRKPGVISDAITGKLGNYMRLVTESGERPITCSCRR